MNTSTEPIYNFSKLIDAHSISLGRVNRFLTGLKEEHVYFAALEEKVNSFGAKDHFSRILTRGQVLRENVISGDEIKDQEIYGLMVMSPWFPLATGPTPQIALMNFIEKMNQPWMTEQLHLLPLTTRKVLERWHKRSLFDKASGEYKFHLEMKYAVPEEEKGLG